MTMSECGKPALTRGKLALTRVKLALTTGKVAVPMGPIDAQMIIRLRVLSDPG